MQTYVEKYFYVSFLLVLAVNCFLFIQPMENNNNNTELVIEDFMSDKRNTVQPELRSDDTYVKKVVLDNGLTILVRESHEIPKVSFQIWYNVGSKDELIGEKGIAHLIEHMIFKGTDTLSESDINTVV